RQWWVFRGDRVVAEVGVLGTGEWWVCPEGEALPWSVTYPSAQAAMDALITWWGHTHPFGNP
ncbi:MAG TPA: hypothetical protein VGR21_12625, partial [Cryptosporangiaceae bacterium]|nr:hypothetical protein [Cryptosporangiaceae bacterium]